MKKITNSLTITLDQMFVSEEELDFFLDGLEDEILGLSTRDFYVKYKGDIKELIEASHDIQIDLSIESELLAALMAYCSQRKGIKTSDWY